jgi:hypothetical protein
MKVEQSEGALHLTRRLMINVELVESKYYPAVRSFFQSVKTGDEMQIVVRDAAGQSE